MALQDRRPVAAAVVVVVVLVVVFRWRIKARPASNPVSGKLLSTEPVSRRPPAHSIMADNRIIKVGRVWPAGGDGETLQTHFSSLLFLLLLISLKNTGDSFNFSLPLRLKRLATAPAAAASFMIGCQPVT